MMRMTATRVCIVRLAPVMASSARSKPSAACFVGPARALLRVRVRQSEHWFQAWPVGAWQVCAVAPHQCQWLVHAHMHYMRFRPVRTASALFNFTTCARVLAQSIPATAAPDRLLYSDWLHAK